MYVDCPEVMEPSSAAAIKGLKMGKAAGPTGVVSEMIKATGGFGSRWMTDLINNIIPVGDERSSVCQLCQKQHDLWK